MARKRCLFFGGVEFVMKGGFFLTQRFAEVGAEVKRGVLRCVSYFYLRQALLTRNNRKLRVWQPAQAGFICVSAISTALLRMVKNRSLILFVLFLSTGIILPIAAQVPPVETTINEPLSPTELVQESRDLYETGKFSQSLIPLQQAAAQFEAAGDELNLAMTLSNLCLIYQQLEQWQNAEEAITQSLNLLQNSTNDSTPRLKLLAQALEVNGKLLLATGQSNEALTAWRKSTESYTQLGDQTGEIRTQVHQSLALSELGLYRQALKTLIPLLNRLQAEPDSLVKATALRALGNVIRVVGDVEELDNLFPLFLSTDQSENLSDLDQSEKILQQSLQIFQTVGDTHAIAETLLGLGNTARAAYYHAKDAFERVENPPDKIDAEKQAKAALDYYQDAVKITTSPITRIQAQLNQLSLLLDCQTWLPEIGDSSDKVNVSQSLKNQQDQLTKLESQIEELPASRTAIYARINLTQNLIKLYAPQKERGTFKQAQWIHNLLTDSVKQAEQLNDKRAEAYALGHLAGFYETTASLTEAQKLTEKAIQLTEDIQANDIAYKWEWQLGRVLKQEDKIEDAIAMYEEAVKTVDEVRYDLLSLRPDVMFSFRDNIEPIYRELVDLLTQDAQPTQANLEKARHYIEQLQVAELEDYLRCKLVNDASIPLDKFVAKNHLNAAIVYPIILADRLEVILKLPETEELSDQVKSAHNVQAKQASWVSHINPTDKSDRISHSILYTNPVSQDQVESTIEELREDLEDRKTGLDEDSTFRKLYDWLIRPAEVYLKNNNIDTLVFVLDGALRNVPMAALYDGNQYLVEHYSIAVNMGFNLLESEPLNKSEFPLLMGGLSEERRKFTALPYVVRELEQISAEIPNNRMLLNEAFETEALRDIINAQPFPVVHFATHGVFSSSPEETYIVAYDQNINVNQIKQLLRSREANLPSAIELLVLSACQTATGDKRAALGIAGVSVQAGARSTIATLFNVKDNSTSSVMNIFYQALGEPGVTKAKALQLAQLAVLNKNETTKKPYYWAPFVLVGNWR